MYLVAMTDRRCCLARPRVVLVALVAVIAVRSLVDGSNTASDLSRIAEGLAHDEYSESRRVSISGRYVPTTHGRRLLAQTVAMSVNHYNGSPTGDNVSTNPDIYVRRKQPTGNSDEIFEDDDDVGTGNMEQSDVELWNTSALTVLDLLPEDLSYSVSNFYWTCFSWLWAGKKEQC